MQKKHLSMEDARRKEQQSDNEGVETINIDDWARAGAELLAIEVQDVSK